MAAFENCKLNRIVQGTALVELLKAQNESLVVNITAPWGYGKTTFLKNTEELLKEKGVKTLYFSAWENDYLEDPFTALFSLLKNTFESEYAKDKSMIEKFAKQAIPIIGNLALRTLTYGALNTDIIERSMGDDEVTQDNISQVTGQIAQNLLASYEATTESVKSFQSVLSELALTNGGSLVIIIDELDRCRPNFAIELLERVKHIMSVEGVKFLLGTDKIQLANSIKALYGSEFDSISYLERFIDYEMYLDIKNSTKIVNVEIESLRDDGLVDEMELSIGDGGKNIFIKQVNSMVLAFELDIRTLKRLFRKLKLILLLNKTSKDMYSLGFIFYYLIRKEDKLNKVNKINERNSLIDELLKQFTHGRYDLLYLCAVIKYFMDTPIFGTHPEFNKYYKPELRSLITQRLVTKEKHIELIEKGLMFLAFNESENK